MPSSAEMELVDSLRQETGASVRAGASGHLVQSQGAKLFRVEALAERKVPSMGSVLLAPRGSYRLFMLFASCACAAVFALLWWGSYTRTAHISGWLVPQQGVVRVFAPRPGVVGALKVVEGTQVHRGDSLLMLSDDLQSAALGATQVQVMRRLRERRESLLNEADKQRNLLAQQQSAAVARLVALDAEHAQLGREIDLLKAREAIAARSEDLHRSQFDVGFISEQRLQLVQAERLEQRARIAALERTRLALERERSSGQAELKALPLSFQREFARVEQSISEVDQERAEAEARREIVLTAPVDGTVTSIQAVAGAGADTTVPLLSIVPSNAGLEAHLYGPSRAVGFIRPGQRVLLRHQAYPYQKFGHQEGVVASVSRSSVSASELPRELSGMGSLVGASASGPAEPVYRITVSLVRQTIAVNGEAVPLRPGIVLAADVALDKRRLFEWVLDPLYTLTRRPSG